MDNIEPITIIVGALFGLVGLLIGYIIRKNIAEGKLKQAETVADQIISKANEQAESIKSDAKRKIKDAEAMKKEKLLEAKEESHRIKQEADREYKERRIELQKFEDRVIQKEATLDKKMSQLEARETKLFDKVKEVESREEEVEHIKAEQLEKLENISNLTVEEAKEQIISNVEKDVRRELSVMIKELRQKTKQIKKQGKSYLMRFKNVQLTMWQRLQLV